MDEDDKEARSDADDSSYTVPHAIGLSVIAAHSASGHLFRAHPERRYRYRHLVSHAAFDLVEMNRCPSPASSPLQFHNLLRKERLIWRPADLTDRTICSLASAYIMYGFVLVQSPEIRLNGLRMLQHTESFGRFLLICSIRIDT